MISKIGETAGKVWEFLNTKGPATITQIKNGIKAPTDLVNQAIGWLAREDKITLTPQGKSLKVSLKS